VSSIRDEAILQCAPEDAFRELADPLFTRRIGFGAGSEVEVLYRDARFVQFRTTVARPGGAIVLESERVLAPESLTMVTLRRSLAAFRYNVIVDCFAPHENGTRFIHVDEFEPATDGAASELVLRGMRETTRSFMETVRGHFACARPAESRS
jgi:hypothetical protein